MLEINESGFDNESFTFFGPMGMAFYDDGYALEETFSVKFLISFLLGINIVLSVIGNTCTCAVIARDRSMWNPTNSYLMNLAITDLMITVFIPLEIYMIWVPNFYPLGEAGCRYHFAVLDVLSNCSVLTILALTVERYLVISKPFHRQKLQLNTRVYKIVAVSWFIAIIFCIPDIFYVDLLERKKYVYCYYTLPLKLRILMIFETFILFIGPLVVIFVLYLLMGLKLKATRLKLRSSPVNDTNKDKAIMMLAAVAGSFFFCWSPYCALRIMLIFPKFKYEDYYEVWRILNYVCSVNGYMSTAINPILYSLMSRKFRKAFKDFLKGRRATDRKRTISLPYNSVNTRKYSEVTLKEIRLNKTSTKREGVSLQTFVSSSH